MISLESLAIGLGLKLRGKKTSGSKFDTVREVSNAPHPCRALRYLRPLEYVRLCCNHPLQEKDQVKMYPDPLSLATENSVIRLNSFHPTIRSVDRHHHHHHHHRHQHHHHQMSGLHQQHHPAPPHNHAVLVAYSPHVRWVCIDSPQ